MVMGRIRARVRGAKKGKSIRARVWVRVPQLITL